MEAIKFIRERSAFVSDGRQGEEWGTEADWDCLLDEVSNGATCADETGTGGVADEDVRLAMSAIRQENEPCEHEWHRFGTVNGVSDVGCQKCGATRS